MFYRQKLQTAALMNNNNKQKSDTIAVKRLHCDWLSDKTITGGFSQSPFFVIKQYVGKKLNK